MTRMALLLGAALALALVGCGGDDDTTTTAVAGDADPAAVAVIDDWAKTLSEGDVNGAAAFFAIPSLAQNGLTLEIRNVGDARRFNASLPCGATLTEAAQDGEFTIATFELTERPGPGACGSGTGLEARTAFKIEDGKIAVWRRVATEPGGDGGDAQPAPASSA